MVSSNVLIVLLLHLDDGKTYLTYDIFIYIPENLRYLITNRSE